MERSKRVKGVPTKEWPQDQTRATEGGSRILAGEDKSKAASPEQGSSLLLHEEPTEKADLTNGDRLPNIMGSRNS